MQKIIVYPTEAHGDNHYVAQIHGFRTNGPKGLGKTEDAAVGNLIRNHGNHINIKVEEEIWTDP